MTLWMFGFAYLVPLAIGLLMLAMPRLNRGSTFFAVTVPADFPASPVGQAIRRRYMAGVLASIVISVAAMTPVWWWLDGEAAMALAHTVGVLGVLFGSLWAFVTCRQRAMRYSRDDAHRRKVELAPPDRLLDIVPRPVWLNALPYLPVLAAWGWLALNADALDASIGPATAWALPLAMLGTLALMHLVMPLGLLIRRLPGHRSRVGAINRMLLWMMLFTGILGGWNTLALLYGERWAVGPLGTTVHLVCILGLLLVPVVMWRTGRLDRPGRPDEGDRSPDSAWKLGMIYFNPDDPALLLEKRFGVGYTINLGRPAAWLIIGAVLGVIGALVWVALP